MFILRLIFSALAVIMPARMALIYITEADKAQHKFRLPSDPSVIVTIGRSEDCLVSLPHIAGVSRLHCSIIMQGGRYTIRDEGSMNGTLADGCPISSAPLRAGVTYSIGTATLSYDPEQPDSSAPESEASGCAKPLSPPPVSSAQAPSRRRKEGTGRLLLLLFMMAVAFCLGMVLRSLAETGAFPPACRAGLQTAPSSR